MAKRDSTATVFAAVPLVLFPLVVYITAYYQLCDYHEALTDDPVKVRIYSHDWQITIFRPAAWLEQKLTGRRVVVW